MANHTIYTFRNPDGCMIAKLGGVTADMILRDASGKWRDYRYTNTPNITHTAYEFTNDFKFMLGNGDNRNTFEVFIFKGSVFIDDNC